ncbi:MAG: MerR family transcriptional regulator [Candidatus Latescibacterota bacterium]
MRRPLDSKLYYSISEVAEITGLPPHTLRAWEREFPCLRPRRSRGKNRAYRDRDVAIVLLLKRLLHEERYTTEGVRQKLRHEPALVSQAIPTGAASLDGQKAVLPPRGCATAPEALVRGLAPDVRALLSYSRQELRSILHLLGG